jgi:cytochrome b involved in lipid metabolism
MKKLSTISLFIFGVVVTAILTAGLVFYQNNKNNQSAANSLSNNLVKDTIFAINPTGGTLTLDMAEISKHNKSSDCFLLISGKVYNITSFFGSHPGGNSVMAATCGTDATDAYMTKDPNAKSTKGGSDHSSNAKSMLAAYYLGDLNQTIGSSKTTTSVSKTTSKTITSANAVITTPVVVPVGNIVLNMTEIVKHNKSSDCFLLISGKVYNITSFFGSHPGGNSVMAATCGTDATDAYMTKDPNATSTTGGRNHSSNAVSMLAAYFIGNLNQSIGQQVVTQTNTVVASKTRGGDDD